MGRTGSHTTLRRHSPQTSLCPLKRLWRDSMWLPFSPAVHLSVRLFHVTAWRARFALMSIACWSRLKTLTKNSALEPSTKPNPVLTVYSPSIPFLGPTDHADEKSPLHSLTSPLAVASQERGPGPGNVVQNSPVGDARFQKSYSLSRALPCYIELVIVRPDEIGKRRSHPLPNVRL